MAIEKVFIYNNTSIIQDEVSWSLNIFIETDAFTFYIFARDVHLAEGKLSRLFY